MNAYETLQDKIAGLLTGANAAKKIAAALGASANTYEREDAEGAHGLERAGN